MDEHTTPNSIKFPVPEGGKIFHSFSSDQNFEVCCSFCTYLVQNLGWEFRKQASVVISDGNSMSSRDTYTVWAAWDAMRGGSKG